MKKYNWQIIIIGLRKKLGLSQYELAGKINVSRQSIGRYELGERKPTEKVQKYTLKFIRSKNLDLKELENLGKKYLNEIETREKSKILKLGYSQDLVELIGIILGDGEIHKDGTIRIAFDPKKDKNFLYRRVFLLIKSVVGSSTHFESNERTVFGNKNFMKFLKFKCNLEPGNKFDGNWKIPEWCFQNKEYVIGVLRGLFDTDGYFGYGSGHLVIMFGRFSDRCENLVKSIKRGLNMLGINCTLSHTKDGRYKISIFSNANALKFFKNIGSANMKHITRFLLWRTSRYKAKIEIEGLEKLCNKINNTLNIEIEKIKLPFLWIDNKVFNKFITEDEAYLEGYDTRDNYDWKLLTKDLLKIVKSKELGKVFNINARSVRKWREGRRIPRYQFVPKLFKLARENGLNINDYEVRNARANDRSIG